MTKRVLFLWPSLLVLGSGCISVGTHEKQMRDCRAMQSSYKELQDKNSALQVSNADLQDQLRNQMLTQKQLEGEISTMRGTYDDLINELKDDIANGLVQVASKDDDVMITMGEKILLTSGQIDIKSRGARILNNIANVLKKVKGREIHVEGYTDNVRLAGTLKARYHSNWELSAMRAAGVVRYLEQQGVDPSIMQAVGFGEHRPLGDNATVSGRQINRRVEITVVKAR
jgi:chemotaxis protein MotB